MGNPVRAMYWGLRKQGLSNKEARARVQNKFKLSKKTKSTKKRKRSGGKTRYWIQKAIKRKGALRQHVQKKYGAEGFKKVGYRKVIKQKILEKLAKEPGIVGKRARLAITLKKLKR